MSDTSPDRRAAIYDDLHHGQLSRQDEANQRSAGMILSRLFQHFAPQSVLDVGCGLGIWLEAAQQLGAADIQGIEGDWLDRKLVRVPERLIVNVDLERPFDLGRRFDLVICLEVAEHLSQAAAAQFIASLVRHADVILFSAAIPFQGGHHHVNEQFLDYWNALFQNAGYRAVDLLRPFIWNDSSVLWWLRQNIVVFAKKELTEEEGPFSRLATSGTPLSVVHPDIYLARVKGALSTTDEYRKLLTTLAVDKTARVIQQADGRFALRRVPEDHAAKGRQDVLQEILAEATRRHQAGDLEGATERYREIIRRDPSQPSAWYLLGAACEALGKLDEAEANLHEALRLWPDHADAYNHLGVVQARKDRLQEASLNFRHALRLRPDHSDAGKNLQKLLARMDVPDLAVPHALAQQDDPTSPQNNPGFLLEKGRHLRDQGEFQESAICLRQAVRLQPNSAEAHHALAVTLARLGNLSEAVACVNESLRLHPDDHLAYKTLGHIYKAQNKLSEAQTAFEKAILLSPESAESHSGLGDALQGHGLVDRAVECYRQALRLRPDFMPARFGACFAHLAGCIYENEDEIARRRADYTRELEELVAHFPFDRPEAIKEAADSLGVFQPFLLPYQGHSDRDLQAMYGRFVSRIMAARYPQWAVPVPMPALAKGERIRVGIVSHFFHRHSNWKIPIRGWVENLDRSKFELFGYYTGRIKDAETVEARRLLDHFTEDVIILPEWCRRILADRLHILLFPETGMETMTVRLAALRLAPVQCTSWGHPNTSGLPTIDYFLSSDLMEPADAQRHYTEELVRLANLSIHYTMLETAPGELDLSAYGVKPGAVRYLCCQSSAKYLPQDDELLTRIAAQVPQGQFIFLGMQKSNLRAEQLHARLVRAFANAGLGADRLVFLPALDTAQYRALNEAGDVFLDSVGWSGCNSTIEALACGLPVVTLPGSFMRGRHSLAILQMIGVTDTVAADRGDYVAKAVRLGRDGAWRAVIRAKVRESVHKAFHDMECIRSLERFLERVVTSRLS